MTTQLDAPAIDLGEVEAFAMQGRRPTGPSPTTPCSSTSATGSASGGRSRPSSPPPATELAERSGLAERYVREWLVGPGRRRLRRRTTPRRGASRCPPSTRWCSPTTTARPPASPASRSSPRCGRRRTSSPTPTPPARASAGTSTTRGCSAGSTGSSARCYRDSLAQRVAAGGRRAGRAARGGHPRRRRRLRPRLGDHPDGRGVPGLDVRRRRLPRGVDPAGDGGRRGGRGRRPGARSRSATRRRTPAPTTWSASSTPCTTWATRSGALRTPAACLARRAARSFAVEPFAEDRLEDNLAQPGRRWSTRGSSLPLRAAQPLGGRCRAGRPGRTGAAAGASLGGLLLGPGRGHDPVQPGDRGPAMNLMAERLTQVTTVERVRQAHAQRAALYLARSRRWRRRAERAAERAQISLAAARERA